MARMTTLVRPTVLLPLLLSAGLLFAVSFTKADEFQTQQNLLSELEYQNEIVSPTQPWGVHSDWLADWITRARKHFNTTEQVDLLDRMQDANDNDPDPWHQDDIRGWLSDMRDTMTSSPTLGALGYNPSTGGTSGGTGGGYGSGGGTSGGYGTGGVMGGVSGTGGGMGGGSGTGGGMGGGSGSGGGIGGGSGTGGGMGGGSGTGGGMGGGSGSGGGMGGGSGSGGGMSGGSGGSGYGG